jgi:rubrerythrin
MKPQFETSATPGSNHSGLEPRPELMREMVEGANEFPPTSSGSAADLAALRIAYARSSEPVATMPPAPGVDSARLPLVDKLGARLQFERIGTRLYDALISKLDAFGTFDGGPTRAQLLEIRAQEHAHSLLAQQLVRKSGGDPTAITPTANLQATASRGLADVLLDPRTSLVDCLETILIAELVDVESWSALTRAVEAIGDGEMSAQLGQALQTELDHLAKVRAWLEAVERRRTAVAKRIPTSS